VWQPQYPLTAAERFVDWPAHNDHIVSQRARVERLAMPTVRRLVLAVGDFAIPVNRIVQRLEDQLLLGLERSIRFGYRESQRELHAQRELPRPGRRSLAASSAEKSSLSVEARGFGDDSLHLRPATSDKGVPRGERGALARAAAFQANATNVRGGVRSPAPAETLLARYAISDAGAYADSAQHGLPGIYSIIKYRSRQVARNVADATHAAAWQAAGEESKVAAGLVVLNAATKALHNSVLELVGEALNLGRTAGALEMRPVPEFALRSAQLDKSSCPECERLHGEIVEVDTSEFFSMMPPADCLGGGRCRCIYVFEGRRP
jgi:hypothetical protein